MSTQPQPVPVPKGEQQPQQAKPRSRSESLQGPDGEVLRFVTVYRRRGAVTFAVHTTKDAKGKRTNVRGATELHGNEAAAQAAVDRMVASAIKLGWVRREGRRGFVARPDAFDAAHLPAASRTAKKR
jgi:hypothetical protein